MAVFGYCAVCEKLVPIKPAGFRWSGDRSRDWFPHPHSNPEGANCPGDKRKVE